jgi:hypothetical protein
MAEKEPRAKMTIAIDRRVREALRRRAEELDCAEATVARSVLAAWARQQPAEAA